MTVDWSQFRDKDRVKVTFEGTFVVRENRYEVVGDNDYLLLTTYLRFATSAELIERPFVPPARGKLFRSPRGWLYQSLGAAGYRSIRDNEGNPRPQSDIGWPSQHDRVWLDSIEVLDI